MAELTPRKTKRNIEIYKRWMEGEKSRSLAKEYGISIARIYVLIHNVRELYGSS